MAVIEKAGAGPWWVGVKGTCKCGCEFVLNEFDEPFNELRGDNKTVAAMISCPSCGERVGIRNPRA